MRYVAIAFALFYLALGVYSQQTDTTNINNYISLHYFKDGIHHWYLADKENRYARYDTSNYIGIANNFVAYQNKNGGWPKNIDWLAKVDTDSLKATLSTRYQQSTFDNRNTWPQIEYLAEAYLLTNNTTYKKSVEKGIKYILNTQNKSGGWRGWDVDAITYNDDVMTGIMNLLLDIKKNKECYKWLSDKLKQKTQIALEKAIDVTLQCQIIVAGKKTAWGQQHDHVTLQSVKARTYELAGITANESVSVLRFLMRVDTPTVQIVDAIEAGVNWLNRSALQNIRVDEIEVPKGTYPGLSLTIDRVVVNDSAAAPIWARYYEIDTNKPFMCTRQGKKVYQLKDVNPERRAGYAWYGYWPRKLLEIDYPKWKMKLFN